MFLSVNACLLPCPVLLCQRQVKEMHQDGKRVKLDVDIQAPEIVVPISSQSTQLVVADLGHLKLANTFHLHPKQPDALFDKYSIQLLDLQLYRYASECGCA